MAIAKDVVAIQPLSLLEELILMLLNEESGYFRPVPGWDLNCAVIGAVLAELSLESRIDTDMNSLFLLDETETGNPTLDPILKEIADEPAQRNAQYWIERLAHHAESIVDSTLDRPSPSECPGIPRRRLLDAGSQCQADGSVQQLPRRHWDGVRKDAHQQCDFQQRDSRPERRHHYLSR